MGLDRVEAAVRAQAGGDEDDHRLADPARDPEHERVFSTLQKYRAAKLVRPVDADHMYFAAMESKACRLTPLGRHYRHVAKEGRL